MTTLRILLFGIALALSGTAHATVYKCIDDRGRVTYTNDRNLARGCQTLDGDLPVSSVPARSTPAETATRPPPKPAASSAGFPRVSPESQRARDGERGQILNQELQNEQAALEQAQAELAAQEELFPPEERNIGGGINGAKRNARLQPFKDQVELHQRNLEALKREISRLR